MLTGKTTLITGASSGIGRACADFFAKAGSNLVLCSRSIDKLEEIRSILKEKYPSAHIHVFSVDVQKQESVHKSLRSLPEEFKDIDVLINNAGLALGKSPIQNADISDWEIMINTNVKGLLYVTHEILPGMIQRGGGTIINLGSIAGRAAYPGGHVYAATKAAVRMISDAIRIDTVGTGVRTTDIEPGMVHTNFHLTRYGGDKEKEAAAYAGYKPLDPEDIADIALYVACAPKHVQIQEVLVTSTDQATATIYSKKN